MRWPVSSHTSVNMNTNYLQLTSQPRLLSRWGLWSNWQSRDQTWRLLLSSYRSFTNHCPRVPHQVSNINDLCLYKLLYHDSDKHWRRNNYNTILCEHPFTDSGYFNPCFPAVLLYPPGAWASSILVPRANPEPSRPTGFEDVQMWRLI